MRRIRALAARLWWRLTFEQYRLGALVLPRLPPWLVDAGGYLLASALALRRSERRLITERNLRRAATGRPPEEPAPTPASAPSAPSSARSPSPSPAPAAPASAPSTSSSPPLATPAPPQDPPSSAPSTPAPPLATPAPPPAPPRGDVRRTFVTYARYYIDCARLTAAGPAEIDAGFTFENYDNIADGLRIGPGVILALPHVGSWEWAGAWLAQRPGVRVTAVVEPIEHEELFRWMERFRRRIGMEIVPAGPKALGILSAALNDGHVVCLLCDRDIGGGGVEVEFFGERTTLPSGAAVLARRTGSPIVAVVTYQRGGRCHAVTSPPVQVPREGRLRDVVAQSTQQLANRLEEMIRAAPTQWHLMQPNWPSDRLALEEHRHRKATAQRRGTGGRGPARAPAAGNRGARPAARAGSQPRRNRRPPSSRVA